MAKREASTRSVRTLSPPPIYSSAQPLIVEDPRQNESDGAPSGSGGAVEQLRPYDPYAMTNGERRVPSDDAVVENLLRLQRTSENRRTATNGSSTAGTASSPETETISHFSGPGYAASVSGSQFEGDGRSFDARTTAGETLGGALGETIKNGSERSITNYISIVRKATPHHRIFSLFYPNPKIIDTFYIDPHLRVPGGVLHAVQSSSLRPTNQLAPQGSRRTEQQRDQRKNKHRKNLSLELEDGQMNVTIHLIADCDPSSSMSRRLRSPDSVASRLGNTSALRRSMIQQRTTITASLSTTRPKTFKAYPMFLKIHAPQPRPPFFLQATCTSPGRTVTRSPVTFYLPRSFHGPINLRIQVGNIDHHLWLSPGVLGVARMMSEDETSRGYFLGALPDTLDEEESGDEGPVPAIVTPEREEEEWQGDKAEIDIGNGRLRLLFEDERLEGMPELSSKGWIWPAKWG
ncbi:hypothetical protein EST38_g4269 [Candolleomyces aberdarensis]|uniref:DUF7330 domain-containing protein n=1 Tax=Candolleomyces aberdarensis TaxID=2316362 RepID=A0A4V1Q4C1_9AGAR|nr:hypothetical protein EST38_g4269 [Candolleomyces aberdarensis]